MVEDRLTWVFSHLLAVAMLAFANVDFLGQEADLKLLFHGLDIRHCGDAASGMAVGDGQLHQHPQPASQPVISPSRGADIIVSQTTIRHRVSVLGKLGFFKTDD